VGNKMKSKNTIYVFCKKVKKKETEILKGKDMKSERRVWVRREPNLQT
jgi:hypothetical protein